MLLESTADEPNACLDEALPGQHVTWIEPWSCETKAPVFQDGRTRTCVVSSCENRDVLKHVAAEWVLVLLLNGFSSWYSFWVLVLLLKGFSSWHLFLVHIAAEWVLVLLLKGFSSWWATMIATSKWCGGGPAWCNMIANFASCSWCKLQGIQQLVVANNLIAHVTAEWVLVLLLKGFSSWYSFLDHIAPEGFSSWYSFLDQWFCLDPTSATEDHD